MGAGADVLLVGLQAFFIKEHLHEISEKPSYQADENFAITDEVSSICTCLARLCRDLLIFSSIAPKDPFSAEVRAGIAGTFAVTRGLQACFQFGLFIDEVTQNWNPKAA